MAAAITATSAHPDYTTRHLPTSLPPDSSALERSTSTSSSATAHPLDNSGSTADSREEKASSSTSSSPTYQSNSSSSNHKTISTTVSSLNTTGSLSPTLANSKQQDHNRLSREAAAREAAANHNSSDTANNEDSWDSQALLNDSLTSKSSRDPQVRTSSGQRLMGGHHEDRWNFSRYRDEDDPYSPIVDEETPIQYPPVSEEDKEARAIEQNLERWAAEEKLRRKALRTSRTGSMLVTSTVPSKLSKRLSALNILGAGKGPMDGQGDHGGRSSSMLVQEDGGVDNRRTWDHDRNSGSYSSQKEGSDIDSITELTNGGVDEARRQAKGKGKESGNPFRDPSTGATEPPPPQRRQSSKPTPRTPIVTPGKAPTIRHRAIEKARKSGGTGRMPSIVATDVDEDDEEAVRHLQNIVIDPFQSAAEVNDHLRQISHRTILDGDEGAIAAAAAAAPGMPTMRKSFSSSKFNEIGLDDEDNSNAGDWSEDQRGYNQQFSKQQTTSPQREQGRKQWWTEWLCGCGNVDEEEEGEQSGRTCPEW